MSLNIQQYYSNKNILLTGGTGFIGKVVLEKLLRVFLDVGEIYVFVRPKKGKTAEERRDAIFSNPLFEKLRNTYPQQLSKVRLMKAELSTSGLGLSLEDECYLQENCNLVFHIAASVQFDKDLRDIAETNLWGLEHMLILAKSMKNLNGFVFCSSTFSQHSGIVLGEHAYEPPIKPVKLKNLLDKFDDDIIDALTVKLLDEHPNTYAFTKAISEDLLCDFKQYFPISIVRPSIVVNMSGEPLPGWTDGLQAFNGWIVVGVVGILKVMYGKSFLPRVVVPVDILANALLIIACRNAKEKNNNSLCYYNVTEDIEISQKYSSDKLKIKGDIAAKNMPSNFAVMNFGYIMTQNYVLFKILQLWYHFIPAILIDALLIIFQQKPKLLSVQRKIIYNMKTISYYTCNPFIFETNEFNNLYEALSDEDKITFPMNIEEAMNNNYYANSQQGILKYILKQDNYDLQKAKRLQTTLYWIGKTIYAILIYWIIKLLYNYNYQT